MDDSKQMERILIVDDVPENIDILVELLTDYKKSAALNAKKALEIARSENRPDLILLDVMMPGIDGFQLCSQLKEDPLTRDIPIIFVTALGDETDETKGFELGAVDYIHKPFCPPVVKSRVRTHLELVAARRELAAQNEVLEERVSRRTRMLEKALRSIKNGSLGMIMRLSRAAEYKDDKSGSHVLRMSRYSAAVAREMGQPADMVYDMLHAASLHDIGKIGVPDKVLLKPGKLDSEDWLQVRRHPQIGHDILKGSDVPMMELATTIAVSHHERWDGKGYPGELSGKEIPLAGRIVALADAFDALISTRPYRDAYSVEEAFSIVQDESGKHFDPEVVDAFFRVKKEILTIIKLYPAEIDTQSVVSLPDELVHLLDDHTRSIDSF